MRRPLVLIAAVGRNGAIGRDNATPWRLAGDLQHFRSSTMGKPLVVGRKTWQSIGRPLPGRSIVVVTRDGALALPPGVLGCRDLDAAADAAEALAAEQGAEAVMVGGGSSIYAGFIGRADRLKITEVDLAPEADAFFPSIDRSVWHEVSRRPQPRAPGEDAAFAFVTYVRR